jgi:uncharacterized protein
MAKIRSLRCPSCKKIVLRSDEEFPFCSERCRLIDLGKWASGAYVISTPIQDPEAFGAAEKDFKEPDDYDPDIPPASNLKQ